MTESRKEINRITGAVSDQTTLIHQIKEGLAVTKENLERTNTEIGTQSGLIQQIEEGIAITEENLGRTNTEIGAQFGLIQQIKEGLTITEENFGKTVTEIDTQSSIIQQIITALEGKAAGGGGGFIYPDGAFAPVTSFTDGKQYALVSLIGGVYRYINTSTYNNYTMNATQITIEKDAGKYVIFSAEPALFTAVASGNGFLLQNGNNYLHGTSSGGTALRFGTTQAVWTVDTSETGGYAEGKYYPKEDANAVWLVNNTGGYNWSIKYETAGSFGYDRSGRDNTYSTGFVSFVLYEYVAGEGTVNPDVQLPTLTNPGSAVDLALGKQLIGADGKIVEGAVEDGSILIPSSRVSFYYEDGAIFANHTFAKDALYRKDQTLQIVLPDLGNATPADVAKGVTFTSNEGVVQVGIHECAESGGMVIKSGTTTNRAINTGLSDIEQFFIYKESVTGTGLIHLHYTKSATSRLYASAWSTQNYGTKTITNGTGGVTVSGGTLTISATQAAQGALSSGVTYKWVAIGKE